MGREKGAQFGQHGPLETHLRKFRHAKQKLNCLYYFLTFVIRTLPIHTYAYEEENFWENARSHGFLWSLSADPSCLPSFLSKAKVKESCSRFTPFSAYTLYHTPLTRRNCVPVWKNFSPNYIAQQQRGSTLLKTPTRERRNQEEKALNVEFRYSEAGRLFIFDGTFSFFLRSLPPPPDKLPTPLSKCENYSGRLMPVSLPPIISENREIINKTPQRRNLCIAAELHRLNEFFLLFLRLWFCPYDSFNRILKGGLRLRVPLGVSGRIPIKNCFSRHWSVRFWSNWKNEFQSILRTREGEGVSY